MTDLQTESIGMTSMFTAFVIMGGVGFGAGRDLFSRWLFDGNTSHIIFALALMINDGGLDTVLSFFGKKWVLDLDGLFNMQKNFSAFWGAWIGAVISGKTVCMALQVYDATDTVCTYAHGKLQTDEDIDVYIKETYFNQGIAFCATTGKSYG